MSHWIAIETRFTFRWSDQSQKWNCNLVWFYMSGLFGTCTNKCDLKNPLSNICLIFRWARMGYVDWMGRVAGSEESGWGCEPGWDQDGGTASPTIHYRWICHIWVYIKTYMRIYKGIWEYIRICSPTFYYTTCGYEAECDTYSDIWISNSYWSACSFLCWLVRNWSFFRLVSIAVTQSLPWCGRSNIFRSNIGLRGDNGILTLVHGPGLGS